MQTYSAPTTDAELNERFDASVKAVGDGIERLQATNAKLTRALRDLLELVCVHGLEQCGDLPAHEFDAIVDGAVQDARRALADGGSSF